MTDSKDQNAKPVEAAEIDEGEVLTWVTHPAKRNRLRTAGVLAFLVLMCLLVYLGTGSTWFTLLGAVILFASLGKFWFPTTFRLTDRGVTIKTTTQTLAKEWRLFRSCYPDKKGILLSPFVEPTRLENFRGVYVMFESNADEVTAFVKERIARANTGRPKAKINGPAGEEKA